MKLESSFLKELNCFYFTNSYFTRTNLEITSTRFEKKLHAETALKVETWEENSINQE